MEERRDPEADLIERASSGGSGAFAEIVRLHQAAVRAYLWRYLRRRDAIDDLSQEVFVGVYRTLKTFRGEAPFRLWVLGVARRQLALYLRRDAVRLAHDRCGLPEAIARWQAERVEASGAAELDLEREMRALETCVASLPPDSATLVAAHYFNAETSVEIARRLGKKENAIRMALLRVRQALRECVQRRLESRSTS